MAKYRKIPTVFEYLPLNEIAEQSGISIGIIERLILEGAIPTYIHIKESTQAAIYPKLEEKDLETLRTIHYQNVPVYFDYESPKGFSVTSFWLHCENCKPYSNELLSLENVKLYVSATGFFKAENIVFKESLATHILTRASFNIFPLSDSIEYGIPPFDCDAGQLEKRLLDELKKPIKSSIEVGQANFYLKPIDINKVIDVLNSEELTTNEANKPTVSGKQDKKETSYSKDALIKVIGLLRDIAIHDIPNLEDKVRKNIDQAWIVNRIFAKYYEIKNTGKRQINGILAASNQIDRESLKESLKEVLLEAEEAVKAYRREK